jgi:cytidyltransferase-like protein
MIIYADMVGDLFHAGHIKFLISIYKKYNIGIESTNNLLYIGLHNDNDVKSYKRLPIINLENRIIMLESCKYVNKVIPNAPIIITKDFLEKYNIDLVIHAHNKEDIQYNDMYKIPILLGKFERIDYTKGISTTSIINKILNI